MCPAWRQAVTLELGIKVLDVVGRHSVEPVRAETRDEVLLDVDPVSKVGVLRHVWRGRNVGHPVVEPAADCPPFADLAYCALVTLPFQRSDLLGDLGLGLATDMSAVRTAVIANANRDTSVPALRRTE